MFNSTDVNIAETENITIMAYQELLDSDNSNIKLWAYSLRIENNSNQKIKLIKKNLYLSDSLGNCYSDVTLGFHGELPELEPGEFFEFEDTAQTKTDTAVLYGYCNATDYNGKELKIKLPIITLSSCDNTEKRVFC